MKDGPPIRQRVRKMKANACIKPTPTRKRKKRYDRKRYKRRNVIERFFRRIKQCRRVATRYEKKAATSPPSSGSPQASWDVLECP